MTWDQKVRKAQIFVRIEETTRALLVIEREFEVVKRAYDEKAEELRAAKEERAAAQTALFQYIKEGLDR